MKVLLASDGSPSARLAEAMLPKLPVYGSAKVDCVHAVAPPFGLLGMSPPLGGVAIANQATALWESAREAGRAIAEESAARLRSQGFDARAAVIEGDPGNAILDRAAEQAYDLVAVGSRGEGAFRSLVLGSVARKLIAHCPRPVLVARARPDEDPNVAWNRLESRTKVTVLVAADGSVGSELTLEWIKANGHGAFDKITTLCVHPMVVVPAGIEPAVFEDAYDDDEKRAFKISENAAKALMGMADMVESQTILARPAHGIIEVSERTHADLVVMSATRHGAIERFLIGSVSYEVATEAPCSVLIVRRS
ncbi:MAG: universal stress protein [Fimbriimonadaceae bacterium]|nr:universal stress protein [Fimbriimonadaceae bacterium]